MKTFQDYQKAVADGEELEFIQTAIKEYRDSKEYKIALDADEYEAERNVTILKFMTFLYNAAGVKIPDFTSAGNKLASNFFHRLITQRVSYSLGNGISFPGAKPQVGKDGKIVIIDTIKEKLGEKFDNILYKAAKAAVIHKVSYIFWNLDHANYFKMTEFMPLFDEEDGIIKAGFRFWSLDWDKKPVTVVKYEEDGYTKYKTKPGSKGLDLMLDKEKQAYIKVYQHTEADGDVLVSSSNYSALPIIPLYGSDHKQSALIGMRSKIDSFDLVKSGFVDDLQECTEIYWTISNAGGMEDSDLEKFRDRLKLLKVAVVDSETPVKAERNEIPVTARETLLNSLRQQIYEDFGGLDVHTIAAGATNDHIDAAYQPVDDEADDFEYQIIEAVQGILALIGEKSVPIFKRNRISNQKEQTEMIRLAADDLDIGTRLKKYPFLTPDEVEEVKERLLAEQAATFGRREEDEDDEGGNAGSDE